MGVDIAQRRPQSRSRCSLPPLPLTPSRRPWATMTSLRSSSTPRPGVRRVGRQGCGRRVRTHRHSGQQRWQLQRRVLGGAHPERRCRDSVTMIHRVRAITRGTCAWVSSSRVARRPNWALMVSPNSATTAVLAPEDIADGVAYTVALLRHASATPPYPSCGSCPPNSSDRIRTPGAFSSDGGSPRATEPLPVDEHTSATSQPVNSRRLAVRTS